MNTIIEFKNECPLNSDLVDAVIDQLGLDDADDLTTLEDINSHGMDAGFGQFVYYTDTVEFYRANRDTIMQQLENDMEETGEASKIKFIMSFNCAKDATEREIAATIWPCDDEIDMQVANCLAWYAAETVARYADR